MTLENVDCDPSVVVGEGDTPNGDPAGGLDDGM